MLRLRSCILTHLLSSPSAPPITLPLHRHISAAASASAVSPIHGFAVEEYLVETCGLTGAQALKASTKLSHLKSPSKPDAVLTYLASLGFSRAAIAAAVAADPNLLCVGVERILDPVVVGLTGLGLSHSEIARLGAYLRRRSIVSRLQYCLPLFGSFENLLRAVKINSNLLKYNLEKTVKPNVAILRQRGLGACDIAKLGMSVLWLLTTDVERFRATVARAEGIGVPPGSGMFRYALNAVSGFSEEKIADKVEYLKKTLRWSDAEVAIAVSRDPCLLRRSKNMLQSKSEFLISEVELEPTCIAHQPVVLSLSLEGRLRPRYYVLKFLKANGLLDRHWKYCTIIKLTQKVFVAKYICPHKEAAPSLAEDYDAACRGELPANFRFTEAKNGL